ncbi:DEAD/DEAH box helicase [Granulicatella sp. zg-ZJ]|uniref:DEAD/DEAH box helicase n=1 Tax=unclassified Granulicatella TaxID=2630493 RepID=UPI0013C068A1|nr:MULTISPECIES: DEAD/DEAH box helicase [unclassified Granulicatella]MBS4750015.1 DEAD/DEAH box helicase [Carnobacteriaceae bacterium zg-ZUI78]NEW62684.1 DEAD/DEAH box helicase [Granulicatella sp. zg-ZJ]NEW65831.1 DEAD/DEAH box helicase [Granulicatella sp. zg-84]QMI86335.1 DEAD/DEAH box helicase [Carnobacteriaceae bacterium zg-84]
MTTQLPMIVQNKMEQHHFERLTPIQEKCFETIKNGEDIVAVSPTGTGKTLAYILPFLDKLEKNETLQLLVLAPSQELAQQIGSVCREWLDVTVQVITGGANVKRQIEQLKKKPEVIVGTPGRLHELMSQTKKIKCHQLKSIVLDEADYLLKEEHLHTVRDIVKRAPSQRQLLFFSATSNDTLEHISKWFNTQANFINVAHQTSNVTHGFIRVEERKRSDILRKLAYVNKMRGLVFVQNVGSLALLYEKMMFENIKVGVLHSDTHHIERKKMLDAFKEGNVTFLLTTDVASRGLDITDLPYVIQYDLPREKDIYLHRAGRTGRMGKSGCVISFVSTKQEIEYKKIVPKNTDIKEYIVKDSILQEKHK